MKKILMMFIAVCLVTLTGCGDKNRMVCTLRDKQGDISSEEKYVIQFEGNEVKEATMTSSLTLTGDSNNKDSIASAKAQAEEEGTTYNELDGIKASVSVNKNKITLKTEVVVAEIDDTVRSIFALDLERDHLKEYFKDGGYTCK